MVEKIKESLPEMWRNSPPWFALMAVVVLFLFYLDRQENRAIEREKRFEVVSSLRIQTCHDVQAKSTQAIENLNIVLNQQIIALDRLRAIIDTK